MNGNLHKAIGQIRQDYRQMSAYDIYNKDLLEKVLTIAELTPTYGGYFLLDDFNVDDAIGRKSGFNADFPLVLPFPATILEGQARTGKLPSYRQNYQSVRQIVVCIQKQKSDPIRVWSFMRDGGSKHKRWIPEGHCFALEVEQETGRVGHGLRRDSFFLPLDRVGELASDGITQESFITYASREAALTAVRVFLFLEALQCSNVQVRDNPPPKALVRQQKRRGQVPMFSFKTLHIDTGDKEIKTNKGGKHESPRLHFRRGHVRRLTSGKKTWVSPCMVGDASKGQVFKDYEVMGEA